MKFDNLEKDKNVSYLLLSREGKKVLTFVLFVSGLFVCLSLFLGEDLSKVDI